MRRPYTLAFYRQLVDRIRLEMPHASIGSDVIVGFPGETDDDFAELESYLAESPLTHVHVFPYSDRPGTEAVLLPSKVHGALVRERASRLARIGRRLHIADSTAVRSARCVRADDRGWVTGGDRQLSEGKNSRRPSAK